jgi:uncharacterized protein YoxC
MSKRWEDMNVDERVESLRADLSQVAVAIDGLSRRVDGISSLTESNDKRLAAMVDNTNAALKALGESVKSLLSTLRRSKETT